jgi:hypothetical protein
MLTHQATQDMHLEFNLDKMLMTLHHLMLVKEITKLRKTKQKPNQFSQLVMDPMELRVLTA